MLKSPRRGKSPLVAKRTVKARGSICTALAASALIVISSGAAKAATVSTPAITVSNATGAGGGKYFECSVLNVSTRSLANVTATIDGGSPRSCAPLDPGVFCVAPGTFATVGRHFCQVTGGSAAKLRVSFQLMDPSTGVPIVAVEGR